MQPDLKVGRASDAGSQASAQSLAGPAVLLPTVAPVGQGGGAGVRSATKHLATPRSGFGKAGALSVADFLRKSGRGGRLRCRCAVVGAEPHGMGFFDRGGGDSDDDSAGPLAAHGVPQAAEGRLAELGAGGLFSSTLSAREFALLTDLGPQPLAQVLGTSVCHVGWQYLPAEAQWAAQDLFCQLATVSHAWDQARRNAFERLREEARAVGADAVVGVRLRRGQHEWARRSVDFVVNGTAIRVPDAERSPQPALVLSDLSVQDYWRLLRGGWSPAGLLAATSVFFVSRGFRTRWRRRFSAMQNQELHEFSDGFAAARRAVVADLRGQARAVGADGILGVSLNYELAGAKISVQGVGSRGTGLRPETVAIGGGELLPIGGADKRAGVVFTVHSVGTAIRRRGVAGRSTPEAVLNLGGAL